MRISTGYGLRVAVSSAALLAISALSSAAQEKVNIYSAREPALIDPLLKAFTAKTGIQVNSVFLTAGLTERVAAEGAQSPADLIMTVDIARLTEAKDAGVTQAVSLPSITEKVPAAYRDGDGHWFGLTMRSRVIYASKERVKQDAITYEELADPKWKGKICTRSGQHAYNTALVASMIAIKGEAFAETWLKGVKANLARKPAGGDREAVRDVQAGLCDLAISNTYYMAAMIKNPEQKVWAESVRMIFPNSADRGSHINISGMALTKNAPNKVAALKLMEFLASDEAQNIYADVNNEYPINPKVPQSETVKSWGALKPDALPIVDISKHRKRASELLDKVGFDQGPGT